MTHRRFLRTTLLSTWLAMACATTLPAQDDYRPAKLPSGDEVYTQAKHDARRRACYRDIFVADYRHRGKTDPRWDAAVEDLLDLYAGAWAQSLMNDRAHRRLLVRAGRRVLASGCDEPLAKLAVGEASYMVSDFKTAEALIPQAARQIEGSSPSAVVRFCAANREYALLAFLKSPGAEAARRRAMQTLIAAIADPALAGDNQRLYFDLLRAQFGDDLPVEASDFTEPLAAVEGAHRYPLLVLLGRFHIAEAWRARGDGYADKVTEAGWAGFKKNLARAADLFAEAHQLRPDFPEAPTHMLAVAAGLSASSLELRAWFDRAVAAQADYALAYSQLLWFMMPRWSGTHEEMMAFAQECVRTQWYDTAVPGMYRVALLNMADDYADREDLYGLPFVRRALRTVHEGYAAEHRLPDLRHYESTLQVVLAALGGRAREAARLYQALDCEIHDKALLDFKVERDWLEAEIAPYLEAHVPMAVGAFDVFGGPTATRYDAGYEAAPIATGDGAPTAASWAKRHAAWIGSVAAQAYREHGQRNAKWDVAAEQLLADYGGFMLRSGQPNEVAKTLAAAQSVLALGCEDPVVLYVAARVHEAARESERAHDLLRSAVKGLDSSTYSDLFSFYAKRRLAAHLGDQAKEFESLQKQVVEHIVRAASDPCFGGGNERFFVQEMLAPRQVGWRGPLTAEAVQALATAEGVHPWIRHTMVGLHHVALAALAPLTAWPEAESQTYFEHVRAAESHLQKAHDLHPEFPEPAAAMIVVRMLEPGAGTVRQWFERSVAAQLDFVGAYQNFAWSLKPEHGGSLAAMHAFAVECLDTDRFDTEVPMQFVDTLQLTHSQLGNWRWAWACPGVADEFERLATSAIEANEGTTLARHVQFGRFMTDWAGGRYERAVAGWEAMDKKLDERWPGIFGVKAETIDEDLRATAAAGAAK